MLTILPCRPDTKHLSLSYCTQSWLERQTGWRGAAGTTKFQTLSCSSDNAILKKQKYTRTCKRGALVYKSIMVGVSTSHRLLSTYKETLSTVCNSISLAQVASHTESTTERSCRHPLKRIIVHVISTDRHYWFRCACTQYSIFHGVATWILDLPKSVAEV